MKSNRVELQIALSLISCGAQEQDKMPSLHLHHPCKSLCSLNSSLPLCFILPHKTFQTKTISTSLFAKNPNFCSISIAKSSELLFLYEKPSIFSTHVVFCSSNGEISNTHVSEKPEVEESDELELLGKPLPLPQNTNGSASEVVSEPPKLEKDEVLAPFLKFFSSRDNTLEQAKEDSELEAIEEVKKEEEVFLNKKVKVEYYDPKPGDFVVGVVVSGNDHKLDINIGADLLGTMLTKEVLPLYDKELPYLLCDFEKDAEEFMVQGRMGIVFDDDAMGGKPVPGRPVVETGTILFAEVLGRTLSGRPLLSTRRLFRRVAWHRVRQIQQLNEPIEVRITEWNTGGLLTRIEGLRAFLPKAELMNKVNNFTDLKENVGRQIYVRISRIDEANNDLILSEREAWEMMYLREGTLLEGTVRKIFPYGAQVRLGDTNRSGLLHISNITRSRVNSVSDLLSVDEKVKVLVVKSAFPDKISLSIADLESEPGLFVSNREKVFSEAEEMTKKYKQKLPAVSATRKLNHLPADVLPFDNEEKLYANWKWFKFLNEVAN
ncbi:30S ribosomal protein S1-like [Thalictrum thalictroides]|uniref:30S ribosomal protein S1-like n=1 Tax=Thalictrum thalictroides TaxID=46969 RepID=A0A7J6UZ27_THATH|nr:30S ribosomal protein S1-like [Thalictrum thalictroides]